MTEGVRPSDHGVLLLVADPAQLDGSENSTAHGARERNVWYDKHRVIGERFRCENHRHHDQVQTDRGAAKRWL
jgi:hypothetical protein